jgi:hypothetical protein
MIKERSKTQDILHHLQVHKSITSMEAINLYKATRLSGIIYALKKRGYVIETENKNFKSKYNITSHYGIYHYKGREEEIKGKEKDD